MFIEEAEYINWSRWLIIMSISIIFDWLDFLKLFKFTSDKFMNLERALLKATYANADKKHNKTLDKNT